ncbi:MAG: CPBP family intramembrane metalloprotease [Phycisphaeraceae bacterium]|nr:CPBP family intramembrane metalloprotease [Phycisphaeraceae bacterium]
MARRPREAAPISDDYGADSRRPLHVLAFILPLLIVYEIGSLLAIRGGGGEVRLGAERLLATFFEVFGVIGVHLPSVLVVVSLVALHVAHHERWRVRPAVLLGMAVESGAWLLPLLVLARMTGGSDLASESGLGSALTIAMGAAIFEEFVFRLVLIALIHGLAVDLMGLSHKWGIIAGVLGSALAFMLFHSGTPGADPVLERAFFGLAGLYLAVVFALRGLGIAVGTHALYDVIALS